MNTTNPFSGADHFMMPQKPSGMLNALTVLTIIGSIFSLFSSVWSFFTAEKSYNDMKKVMSSGELDQAPAFVKGMVNAETMEMTRLLLENKWPILFMGILGAVLCLAGAFQMRKLQKQGYFLWMAGEILPILGTIVLLGSGSFKGWAALAYLFPIGFIIMYTISKKELVN